VNKSLLIAGLALGVVGALGALYATRTGLAKAPPASASAVAASLPSATAASRDSAAGVGSGAGPAASSPEAERLDARRQLYAEVDALLQASELEKARQLLDEDVARYGDDLAPEWHDLEQSYRLIADCLEHPSAKLRVRAESFVLVSQASSLKPRILSACAKPTQR
jgi:hypothetical protein